METKTEGADVVYKFLILGESNVGKTSILLRYIDNTFKYSDISTCGIDVKVKYVSCNNKKIKLNIWDTAGQERFRGLTKNYFRGAHGFIFIYDITNKESFDKLKGWMKDAKEKIQNDDSYKMIIVGNKKDCENKREIEFQTLKEFGEEKKVNYFEVSAKTGEGIDKVFNDFVHELLKFKNIGIYTDEPSERTYSTLEKSILEPKKKNCC